MGRTIGDRVVLNVIIVRHAACNAIDQNVIFCVIPKHVLINVEAATAIIKPNARKRIGIALTLHQRLRVMKPVMVNAGSGRGLITTGINLAAVPAKQHCIEQIVVIDILVNHTLNVNPLPAYIMDCVIQDGVVITVKSDPGCIISDVIHVLNQVVDEGIAGAFESDTGPGTEGNCTVFHDVPCAIYDYACVATMDEQDAVISTAGIIGSRGKIRKMRDILSIDAVQSIMRTEFISNDRTCEDGDVCNGDIRFPSKIKRILALLAANVKGVRLDASRSNKVKDHRVGIVEPFAFNV